MTILKDLPAGSLVKDPKTLYNGVPVVWKVVAQNGANNIQGYPLDSTTLMTKDIISVKTFDQKEPGNTNASRKSSGNNRWLHSNIRQWLNSETSAPWFTPQQTADVAPSSGGNGNSYDSENGFLSYASQGFRNAIMVSSLKTTVPTVDGGGVETTQDKIFLFSMTEMGFQGSTGKEGAIIPFLNSPSARSLKPTAEAVSQSNYKHTSLSASANYYYWMRSAYPDFAHIGYRVAINGAFTQTVSDNDTIGIAPATNLDGNSAISHQDSDGAYVLAFGGVVPTDLSGVKFKLTETVTSKEIAPKVETRLSGTVKLNWNADEANILFTAEVKKDGSVIPYQRNQSITEMGTYTVVITATDKVQPVNQRISDVYTILLLPPRKDLQGLGFKINDSNTSKEITDGSQFIGKVIPSWESFNGVTIRVTYSVNGTSKGTLTSGSTQTTSGQYQVSYLLTDDNYPDNQLTGIVSFEVVAAPIELGDLKITDVITSRTISDNAEFETKVNPTWTEDPNVSYAVTMNYNGSLISYAKGNVLSNVGSYSIRIVMTDKKYPTNTKTVEVPFKVIDVVTELDYIEPVFMDINLPTAANVEITEGMVFSGADVKPYWESFPVDVKVTAYSIKRNGTLLPFTPNNDIYSDEGSYQISLTLENGRGDQKVYLRNFQISSNQIDIDITVVTLMDGSEISEGRVFEEEQVIPDWDDLEGINQYYTLKFENEDFTDFTRGNTVLAEKGTYVIEIILEEDANPVNTVTVTRTFVISERKINFAEVTLNIYNDMTGIPINDGDVYRGIYMQPQWNAMSLPADVISEAWLSRNGERRAYDRMEEPAFNDLGSYVLEVKVTDPNFPTNFKVFTRTFTMIAESVDLGGKEIVIKNKITDAVIAEGEIFRGDDAAVQPTWSEYPELTYTYKLWKDGVLVSGYKKDNILREKGSYRLTVEAVDPNYPENKITSTLTFAILDEMEPNPEGNAYEEAYLNALPYAMGTPITKSGDYNLLVVRRKKSNFQVSMSDIDFKVTRPDEDHKPLIMINPEVIPSVEDEITIRYPSYSSEEEYKIDSGEWQSYDEPFKVTDNCTITARYKNTLGYYVEVVEDVTNIDKLPPDPPVILGFKDGVDVYLTVSPTVETVYGVEYSATLNGEPYELGTPIYNEVAEIRNYTLVVTAKKTLNGMTASTVRKFTLDSVPPLPPKIVGVQPDIIQESARPEVDGFIATGPTDQTKENYMVENEFEARLNGRLFTLGTLVNDPNSYQVSVTATKKINGLRATSWVVFTVLQEIPPAIGPLRISLEPLTEENRELAVDGEMIVDKGEGHISIYDDGYLISKTRELEDLLDLLDTRTVAIDITLRSNEARVASLKILLKRLRSDVAKLNAMNFETETDISYMNSIINYLDFVDLSVLSDFEKELKAVEAITEQIRTRIDALKARLNGQTNLALQVMDGLQNNSSLIGEVIYLKASKALGRPS
jgi:Family of unknown function (DUF6273)